MYLFGSPEGRAASENRRRRNIREMGGSYWIGDLLFREVGPGDSLLLDGGGGLRRAALYRWLEQLYASDSAQTRPVIVVGPAEGSVADWIMKDIRDVKVPARRRFQRIRLSQNPNSRPYELFLGLSRSETERAIATYARRHQTGNLKWTVFRAVCSVLEQSGYPVNLYNILTMYAQGKTQLGSVLESQGEKAAAAVCRSDAGSDEFNDMYAVLESMQEKMGLLKAGSSEGISLSSCVENWRQDDAEGLPFFYFELPDSLAEDFLEYLQLELTKIGNYCSPILVVDTLPLQYDTQRTDGFFRYILTATNLALTITAQSCLSMIPADQEKSFITLFGRYQFYTMLLGSSNPVEIMIKDRVGTYFEKVIHHHNGVDREFMRPLPRGRHKGTNEDERELCRIRLEDMREVEVREARNREYPDHPAGTGGAYVIRKDRAVLFYRSIQFD